MARRVSHSVQRPWAEVRRAVAAALLLAGSASGCSFIFSEGAPERHESLENFACGESYAPPVLDTIAAGLLALGAANAASNKDTFIAEQPPADRDSARRAIDVTIGVSAAFALVDAASAVYGYRAVNDCQEARGARDMAVARARALPPPYGVPPYGTPPPAWPPPAMYAPPTYAPPPATPVPQGLRDGRPTLPPLPPTAAPVGVPPEDLPPPRVTPLPDAAPSP
jgi:hypothetical protein